MTGDVFESGEGREWAERVRRELVPMIEESAITVSVAPPSGEFDVKIAVELGVSILLDKPIIAVIPAGRTASPALLRVADRTFEMPEPVTEGAVRELYALVEQVLAERAAV